MKARYPKRSPAKIADPSSTPAVTISRNPIGNAMSSVLKG